MMNSIHDTLDLLVEIIQQAVLGVIVIMAMPVVIGLPILGIAWTIEKVFRIEGLVDRTTGIPRRKQ